MRATTYLMVALLLGTVLAGGCLGGKGEKSPSPTASGSSSKPATSTTKSTTRTVSATTGTSSSNQEPVAAFKIQDNGTDLKPDKNGSYPALAGRNLTFDGSTSEDPDGDELTYAWNFGDGGKATGAKAVHAFKVGIYSAELTVTDSAGKKGRANASIDVSAAAPAYIFFDGGEDPAKWTFITHIGQPPAGPPPDPFGECVDSGQNHQLAVGWHTTTKQFFAGSKSYTLQDEEASGYHDDEYTTMTSPAISLKGVPNAFLSFEVKGDSEKGSACDGLFWEISADAGKTWKLLGKTQEILKEWTVQAADLSAYADKDVQIRLRFMSDSSCSIDSDLPSNPAFSCGTHDKYAGYFVDDITVAPG